MIKKILYILDGRQKRNFLILDMVILLGSFTELLGVALLTPIVTVITDETIIENDAFYRKVGEIFNLQSSRDYVLFFIVMIVTVYFIKNLYILMQNYLQYRYIYNNQRRITTRFMRHYMHKEYLFHTSTNIADIQRNIVSDVGRFFDALLNVFYCINESLVCIVLVVYLAILDPVSTLAIAGVLGIFVGGFYLFYRKISVRLGEKSRIASAEQSKWILQGFAGIKDIKILEKEDYFADQYDAASLRFANVARINAFVNMLPKPIMEFVCVGGLLIIVGIRVAFGADLKSFIPILSVFVVAAFRMLPSFNRITAYIGTVLYGKSSVGQVYKDMVEVRESEEEQTMSHRPHKNFNLESDIKLQGITFCYPEGKQNVLEDVELVIPKKSTVALIGASGAGKSTLADIILGVLKPQKGTIMVDGVNALDYVSDWHQCLGYVPQVIYLMDDTIRNNIALGIAPENVDEDALWRAVKDAQLEEFILSLPNGMDTMVGDRGVRLSGGQRQRIGIARALYRNPKFLVLDEATSALDNDTEKAVMEAIDSLHGSRTMLIIAHRLTTIVNSDYIYEVGNQSIKRVEKQRIIEQIDTGKRGS